jgi:hypothetical protein
LEDLGVDGRIILNLIFKNWDGGTSTESMWLRRGTGCCEYGDEPSGSIKCGEFLE